MSAVVPPVLRPDPDLKSMRVRSSAMSRGCCLTHYAGALFAKPKYSIRNLSRLVVRLQFEIKSK